MSILTKEETRAVQDSDEKLFKQGAACFVGSQHKLSCASPLSMLRFNSFCESLFECFLLCWVRASESAFPVYTHDLRERSLRGGMGVRTDDRGRRSTFRQQLSKLGLQRVTPHQWRLGRVKAKGLAEMGIEGLERVIFRSRATQKPSCNQMAETKPTRGCRKE